MENILNVKILREGAVIPARATEHSAGYDLAACIDAPVTIPARGRASVPAGVAVEIPAGFVGLVFGRSGLGVRHGIVPSNAVGVIDSDYRGEIVVGLTNQSVEDYAVAPGERVAQLVLMPVYTPEIRVCEELSATGRGSGGFGSTGR